MQHKGKVVCMTNRLQMLYVIGIMMNNEYHEEESVTKWKDDSYFTVSTYSNSLGAFSSILAALR